MKINQVLCTRGHSWKLSQSRLIDCLQALVPGLDASWILENSQVKLPSNVHGHGDSKGKVLNTKSGKFFSSHNVISENSGPCALLSQWINVGGEKFLVFFDSGASNNIISRRLAMSDGVQFINADSLTFSGVGGSKVSATLGTYRLSIGPTQEGKYYEVYCTAMDTVTADFPEFSVVEVQEESPNFPILSAIFRKK